MGTKYIFDVDIATEYGVNVAVILENLHFWIKKNEANERNYHDGRYWTYNSVKAFETLFPFLGKKAIATALAKAENEGLIYTGNYNEQPYDRTKWYALSDKGYALFQNGDSIVPKWEMDSSKMGNGDIQNGATNTIYKPNTKPASKHRYGEYENVLLSDEDLGKLKAEFPNDWQERIERLSSYMASTGKSYKNHLATIRNWAKRDRQQSQKSQDTRKFCEIDRTPWASNGL